MKLNLGSGDHYAPGWVNVDIQPTNRPDVVATLTHLPFHNRSVSHVYAGHVLEHINPGNLPAVLTEIRRVLNGELMVVGPDLSRAEQDWPEEIGNIRAGGGRWEGDAHQWDSYEHVALSHLTDAGYQVTPLPITDVPAPWPVVSRIGWQHAALCQ